MFDYGKGRYLAWNPIFLLVHNLLMQY